MLGAIDVDWWIQRFAEVIQPCNNKRRCGGLNSAGTRLAVQVQEQGMQGLCAAYRTLDLAAASQLLGHRQLDDKDALVIALVKAVADWGNNHARKALDEWQLQSSTTALARLTFRG